MVLLSVAVPCNVVRRTTKGVGYWKVVQAVDWTEVLACELRGPFVDNYVPTHTYATLVSYIL